MSDLHQNFSFIRFLGYFDAGFTPKFQTTLILGVILCRIYPKISTFLDSWGNFVPDLPQNLKLP